MSEEIDEEELVGSAKVGSTGPISVSCPRYTNFSRQTPSPLSLSPRRSGRTEVEEEQG